MPLSPPRPLLTLQPPLPQSTQPRRSVLLSIPRSVFRGIKSAVPLGHNRIRPYFIWIMCVAQFLSLVAVFGINYNLTGSLIHTHSQRDSPTLSPLNTMVGPAPFTLVYAGARYTPCMKKTGIINEQLRCPNSTVVPDQFHNGDSMDVHNNPLTTHRDCKLEDICGFGGFEDDSQPYQWFRFLTFLFIHVGLVHLLFILIIQLTFGAWMELIIGSLLFAAIYMLTGVGGMLFASIFASPYSYSTGATSAVAGLIGLRLVDTLTNGDFAIRVYRPLVMGRTIWSQILMLVLVITFGLLVPGVDNMANV
ncbi:hypothetical protein GQ42DRAFT_125088, partial [Ramicandelaber brevisporus]